MEKRLKQEPKILRKIIAMTWFKARRNDVAESNMVMLSLNYALDEIEELETGKYNIFDNTNANNGSIENRGQWFQ